MEAVVVQQPLALQKVIQQPLLVQQPVVANKVGPTIGLGGVQVVHFGKSQTWKGYMINSIVNNMY